MTIHVACFKSFLSKIACFLKWMRSHMRAYSARAGLHSFIFISTLTNLTFNLHVSCRHILVSAHFRAKQKLLIKDRRADSKNYENFCLSSDHAKALEKDFQSGVITQDSYSGCTEGILTRASVIWCHLDGKRKASLLFLITWCYQDEVCLCIMKIMPGKRYSWDKSRSLCHNLMVMTHGLGSYTRMSFKVRWQLQSKRSLSVTGRKHNVCPTGQKIYPRRRHCPFSFMDLTAS